MNREENGGFTITIGLAWIGATFVAAITMVSFAYAEFRTVREAEKFELGINKRLDIIDHKLDRILYHHGE